ncbi:MAG: O-antigen ligase family protein [Pseudomonadota bacterium]
MTSSLRLIAFLMILVLCVPAFSIVWAPLDGQTAVELEMSGYGYLVSFRYGFLAAFAALFLFPRSLMRATLQVPWLLLALGAWLLFTVLWALDPIDSLFHSVVLMTFIVAAIYLVEITPGDGALRGLWLVSLSIVLLAILLGLAQSAYGLMAGSHAGLWRGIFVHKNHFGLFLSFFFVWTVLSGPLLSRRMRLFGCAAALVCLVPVGSASAVALTASGLCAGFLVRWLSLGRISGSVSLTSSLVIFVVGLACIAMTFEILVGALNRDVSLTGRTELWGAALDAGLQQFWGFGYRSGGGEDVLIQMRLQSGWMVAPSTHNGYLTLLLDGGFVALVLWCLWQLSVWVNAVLSRRYSVTYKSLITGFTAIFALNGFVDSVSTAYPSYGLFLLLLVWGTAQKEARRSSVATAQSPRPFFIATPA